MARKNNIVQGINPPSNTWKLTCNFPIKSFNHSKNEASKYHLDTLYVQGRKLGHCFKYGDKYMSGH